MGYERVLYDQYEIPVIKGLEYLFNEKKSVTDYLFVNEPRNTFSIYFEEGLSIFKVPEKSDRDYCLFELKRSDRVIKVFCPEKHKNLNSADW